MLRSGGVGVGIVSLPGRARAGSLSRDGHQIGGQGVALAGDPVLVGVQPVGVGRIGPEPGLGVVARLGAHDRQPCPFGSAGLSPAWWAGLVQRRCLLDYGDADVGRTGNEADLKQRRLQ